MQPPLRQFCDRPAEEVAPDLIGAFFAVSGVGGIVVEAEAYAREDPASHSFNGETIRNAAMFGPPATSYVYRSYGLHWCFNIVCRPGSAVLLRAIEPSADVEAMIARRGIAEIARLCSGPGKLCQALGIGKEHDFLRLDERPFELEPSTEAARIMCGPRIGITKAADKPWRFGLEGSSFLSRRFPPASTRTTIRC